MRVVVARRFQIPPNAVTPRPFGSVTNHYAMLCLPHLGGWAFADTGFEYRFSEFLQIHGLEPVGQAPSIPEYMALARTEDQQSVAQRIQKMFANQAGFNSTKQIVRSDGEIRSARCIGTPPRPPVRVSSDPG